jgi:tetratricopeptide (TPR) repeat protein
MSDLKTALLNAINNNQPQLQAILRNWDEQEQKIRQPQQEKAVQATTTTTEEVKQEKGVVVKGVFAFIKANPGVYTGQEAAQALEMSYGYNPGSVLACISQYVTAGHMDRAADGKLTLTVDEYTPLNAAYFKALKNSPKHKRARALAALEKAREVRAANTLKRKKAAERAERKAAKIAEAAANRGDYEAERAAAEKVQGIAALQPAPTPVLEANKWSAESVLNNMSIVEVRKLYDELKKIFG